MKPGNRRLDGLSAYPFARLRALLADVLPPPGKAVLDLTIGEPKRAPPSLLTETLAAHAQSWNRYAPIQGTAEFRGAAAAWLRRRYDLPDGFIDPDRMVVPLAGTREGLFAAAQLAVAQQGKDMSLVAMPEPGYAVYEGAAVMAGARPYFLPARAAHHFLPRPADLADAAVAPALIYLCSPANPQGTIADTGLLEAWIDHAAQCGAVLAVDECYADLYRAEPPPGALQIAARRGSVDGLLVFHSLSKRSSAAGLRSGFVAGDPELLAGLTAMRAFSAAGTSYAILAASAALWSDDTHASENRKFYNALLTLAERVLGRHFPDPAPQAGFFLWLAVGDDEQFARRLWQEHAIRVLPGRYLGPSGQGYVRLALVYPETVIEPALRAIAAIL